MTDKEKIKDLQTKRAQYEEKLAKLKFGFRGVRHEDSASEIRYSMIKVYEDFINSIDDELRILQKAH